MHFPNYFSNFGQVDGQRVVLEEAAEVVEGEGYGLDKVILALEEADKFDPRQYLGPAREELKKLYMHKVNNVLGSAGKA